MTVEFQTGANKRSFEQDAVSSRGTWEYSLIRVLGEANPEAALYAAILADAPFFWYGLSRRSLKATDLGNGIYSAEVPYVFEYGNAAMHDPTQPTGPTSGPGGGASSSTPSGPANENERVGPNVTMNIGGRPPKIVRSLNTYDSVALAGVTPPNYEKSINVQADGKVDGCEVPDPESTFDIDLEVDYVTWKYIRLLQSMVYKTNNAMWFTYLQHSVCFMGGTLKTNPQGRVSLTLKFGTSRYVVIGADEIRTGLPSAGDAPVTVPGWHYLWVKYRTETDAGRSVERAFALYVEQILANADFSLFGIGV